MANVQLPNINITPSDIDSASLPSLQKIVKGLLNTMAIMTEELTYLLNNLDTRNVNEIDGDVLVSGTVTANALAANSVTADKIQANAVTAGKIDVDELSAISANLGHITAGLIEAVNIFGSYIATSQSFPRSEMSDTSNMFAARASSSNSIEMRAAGSNAISDLRFMNGSNQASMSLPSSSTGLYVNGQTLTAEFDNIYLRGYYGVEILSWDRLRSNEDSQSLSGALSELAYNMTFDSTTRNLKLWSKGGQLLAQVNIT